MRPHLTCGMSPAIWDSLNAESNTLSRNLEIPSALWEVTELCRKRYQKDLGNG